MKKFIIKCPKCGCEYLIEEIYLEGDILGKPHNIIKNDEGEIEFFEGDTADLKEEYICDNCGCHFEVEGNITFKTKEIINNTFEEEYTTKIYSDRIALEEPKN